MKRVNWKVLFICLFIVYLVAFIGSLLTTSSVNSSWYTSIKPTITPPNWVFPVVWNILFLLIAISLYFAWTAKSKNKKEEKNNKTKIATVFGINLFLNLLWSFLFFYLQSPKAALYELIFFLGSIIAMIIITHKIKKVSAYLLIPYAVWVAFAGILNYLTAFA